MGNRNVTSAQKDHKSVGKRQPCERFLSLRLDRLLDTDSDWHSSPHAYHISPEYWCHDTSWTAAGWISDDCRVPGVVIHHDVVLPVHSSCGTHLQFDAAPIFILGAKSCLDRSGVKCFRHRVFDAGSFIRGRAASDLFPSCASGRSARDSNDWRRPSKLGIRCRHHASNGASRDHIR